MKKKFTVLTKDIEDQKVNSTAAKVRLFERGTTCISAGLRKARRISGDGDFADMFNAGSM